MSSRTIIHKRVATSSEGIFYKEIFNENNKVVDKVFLIRFCENARDKQLTMGKASEGVNIKLCKEKRIVK